jgi:hypothetical protein
MLCFFPAGITSLNSQQGKMMVNMAMSSLDKQYPYMKVALLAATAFFLNGRMHIMTTLLTTEPFTVLFWLFCLDIWDCFFPWYEQLCK